jgi:membrane protein required for colicin V production
MHVNGLDMAVFLLMAVYGAIGAWRGFLRESISLFAWALAIAAAWLLAGFATARLAPHFADVALARIGGAVLVFMAVFILVLIAGFIVRRMFFRGKVSVPGRIGGGLLGAARGATVVLVVVLLAGLFSPFPQKPLWRESFSMSYFQALAHKLKNLFPPEVAREFHYS